MKTRKLTMPLIMVTAILLSFLAPGNALAANCVWDGSSGNWSDAARWSCAQVPGLGDDATINGGTVTLTADATVASLTLANGTLTGSFSISAGTINWYGGTMSGGGSTTATSTAVFTGSDTINLDTRAFYNAGTATWNKTGSGYLYIVNSAVFTNQPGATLTVQSAASNLFYGFGSFVNAGTLTKSSAGSTSIDVSFNNTGTVNVQNGTLELKNGGTNFSSGILQVSPGAVLRFSGTNNLSGTNTGSGAGTVEIAGTVNVTGTYAFSGTTSITGGIFNLNADAAATVSSLSQSAGTLTGPGHLTAGTLNWYGGTMSGGGSTTITSTAVFTGNNTITLDTRALNNAGTAAWNKTDPGYLYIVNSAVFTNQPGATLTVQSAASNLFYGFGSFVNAGTLTKSGPGNTTINLSSSNTGTINVVTGTLGINNTGTYASNGIFQVSPGAVLRFSGTNNLSGTNTGSGAGTVEIAGTVNVTGTYAFSGTTSITGGIFSLNAGAAATVSSLSQSGGTLTGPGHLTAGTLNWYGGTMSGGGSTTITSTAVFTGNDTITLDNRALNNAGTAAWNKTDPGYLYIVNSAVFNNQPGATITVQSAASNLFYGFGSFVNAGTLTKSGPGNTTINLSSGNTGTINVVTGTLGINNTGTYASNGVFQVSPGAVLRFSGTNNLSGTNTGSGAGTVEIAGTVNVTGTYAFSGTTSITGGIFSLNAGAAATVSSLSQSAGTLTGPGHLTAGNLNWYGGTMSGSGSTTITSTAVFTGNDTITLDNRALNNAGTAIWNKTDPGYLYIVNSAVFTNQPGATLTVQSAASNLFYGFGSFVNAGTLNLTTGKISLTSIQQAAGGITNLAIRGTTPISDYCQWSADNMQLSGPLNISFTGAYSPQAGDQLTLFWYGNTLAGDYTSVNVVPRAGIAWNKYYLSNAFHLDAIAEPFYLNIPLVIK
ncbi:MAG: beta strand repeat-containing protein [Anaerolineae bacterium]